jgi:hypothetical protein
VRIHLLIEHPLELETPDIRLQGLGVRFDCSCGLFVVLAFRQLQQLGGVRDSLAGPVDLRYGRSQSCPLATQLLCTLLVRPDARVLELAGDLLEPFLLLVVLKETP